jgi:hypothetical protein
MAKVRRYDSGTLAKPVKEANGWLRVDAYLTRTGVFAYQNADGTRRLEYRPPDEVFRPDSMSSFTALPFTNDHPPEVLDATNTKKYQAGHLIGAPVQDGDKMRASILVTDADTIAAMEAGKNQISNGYFCDLEETPGLAPDGQRYDAVQKNIVGNHVALVDFGRAGSDVRARMDAADAVMVPSENDSPITAVSAQPAQGARTMKLKIDGIEFDVADAAGQAFEKQLAALNVKADAAKADADKAAARADALAKELETVKAELTAAPEKVRAEITARAQLEASVRKVCGASTKVDGVDAKELRKLIAGTAAPEGVTLDDKSDAYLDALVDLALKKADEKSEVEQVVASTKQVEHQPAKPKDLYEAATDVFKRASEQARK